MKSLGFEMKFILNEHKHHFNFYRILKDDKKINITNWREMPWNMSPTGEQLNGPLWPKGWPNRDDKPVIYIPNNYELTFIVNGLHGSKPILTWNNLNTTNWSKSWESQVIDTKIKFHGLFVKNDVIYAIGDQSKAGQRESQVFKYDPTSDSGRNFVKTVSKVYNF